MILPVSLAISIFQVEALLNYKTKDYKLISKIQLLDGKNWKIAINGSNSTSLEDKDNKEEFNFNNLSDLFKVFKNLNLGVAISYSNNGHTFTLKWKGDVGNDKFSYNPFSTLNKNFDEKTLKYIVALFKLSYKYESKENKKTNNNNYSANQLFI